MTAPITKTPKYYIRTYGHSSKNIMKEMNRSVLKIGYQFSLLALATVSQFLPAGKDDSVEEEL